jgi:hypothetical protein
LKAFSLEPVVTFDATPSTATALDLDLASCERLTVCDLTGVERFLVWGVRWCASLHEDREFADMCLQDSFDRAGLSACLTAFRRYVAMVHGEPAPCPPAARLGSAAGESTTSRPAPCTRSPACRPTGSGMRGARCRRSAPERRRHARCWLSGRLPTG